MKKKTKVILALLSAACMTVGMATMAACGKTSGPPADHTEHVDVDPADGKCDVCGDILTCIVTFDSKGGSEVAQQAVQGGEKITPPGTPTRYGYNFVGWYKNDGCTEAWNFDSDIATGETLTLYGAQGRDGGHLLQLHAERGRELHDFSESRAESPARSHPSLNA